MYKDYFGLSEPPFSIAPDPRYLYMSERHREALAHLIYGVGDEGGFVVLTGEVGTGKTTVCRCLLEQLPGHTEVALILNPKLTVAELLGTVCDELHIAYPSGNKSIKTFVDRLNAWLLEAHADGRHTVLIIDEAQNLSAEVLEQLRLLTNLETNQKKLLQIILLGQPELNDMLARADLRQLAQRITARYHLTPLSRHEVESYISHRLAVAGQTQSLFNPSAIGRVAQYSQGTPRLINVLCDRSLLGAYAQESRVVDARIVSRAACEIFGQVRRRASHWPALAMASIILLGIGAGLAAAYYHFTPKFEVQANAPSAQDRHVLPMIALTGQARAQSFHDLFAAWQIDYDTVRDGDPCVFAEAQGLGCLDDKGSIGALRRLNRPALLSLWDAELGERYATLVGIDDDQARLLSNGAQQTLRVDELSALWQGDFTMFWLRPPHYQEPLQEGSSGEAVQWLDRQLARIAGRRLDAGKIAMDSFLIAKVQDFQHAHGLESDGIAGPKTLIHLNTAMKAEVPLLHKGKE